MTSDQQAAAGPGGPQNVLEEILAGVREDVAGRQDKVPLEQVRELAAAAPPAIDAYAALRKPGVAVIAEVKRSSPSKGAIADIPDPAELAGEYAAGGARCISVLTEGRWFGGPPPDLPAIRSMRLAPTAPTWFCSSSRRSSRTFWSACSSGSSRSA